MNAHIVPKLQKENKSNKNLGLITASVDWKSFIHPTHKIRAIFCCIFHIASY